jgi:hypothetical protein
MVPHINTAAPSCKVSAFFESHNGKRMPLRGESGEYSLEVVRHDPDNRGEPAFSTASVLQLVIHTCSRGEEGVITRESP